MGVRMLRDRDEELLVIQGVLDSAAAGAGQSLIAYGGAGSGKTTLLSEAATRAGARGFLVLRARGSYLEHDLQFGLVGRLFDSVMPQLQEVERSRLRADLQPLTVPANRGAPGPEWTPGITATNLETLHAALSRLITGESAAPLLLLIDNLHWADVASLRWLASLPERSEHLPVAMLASVCGGLSGTDPGLLSEIIFTSSYRLRLAALGLEATAAILSERLGIPPHPAFVAASLQATGGNPLLLVALARRLVELGTVPDAESADALATVVLDSLALSLQVRLRRISSHALAVFRAIAVFDGEATHDRIARLTGIDVKDVANSTVAMTQMGLLVNSQVKLAFAQPLLRNAVMHEYTFTALREVHGQAARLLQLEGEPATAVCEHLLASGPLAERWVPSMLRSAARQCLLSEPQIAQLYLRRALVEPLPDELRAAVLADLAIACSRTDLASTSRSLAEAGALRSGYDLRTQVTPDVFDLMILCGQENQVADLIDSYADSPTEPLDSHLLPRLAVLGSGRPGRSLPDSDHLGRLRTAEPDSALPRALMAFREISGGDLPTALALAGSVMERAMSTPEDQLAWIVAARVFSAAGQPTAALAYCDATINTARRWMHQPLLALARSTRSSISRALGNLTTAGQDARAGLEGLLACRVSRRGGVAVWLLAVLVLILTDCDRTEEATETLELAELTGTVPEGRSGAELLFARGRLRVATGQLVDGVNDLIAGGERFTAHGVHNPALAPWRSAVALPLQQLGQVDAARRYATQEVELARRWGAPEPLANALRVLALLDEGPRSLTLLEESLILLQPSGERLALARSLLDYGSRLLHDQQTANARQTLRDACRLAEEIESPDLVRRSRSELAAAGGRLRRSPRNGIGSLTDSERKVISLAANRKTNRVIAQMLFVQQRTVEIHLTNAYRKLGIEGRSQLPAALERTSGEDR
jgi:DNA-binding CsgD family transcriptional regulator